MDGQAQFVADNSALDRAYLNGTLGECLDSLVEQAQGEIDDERNDVAGNAE